MDLKQLQERIRSAEICKDPMYAIQALEDYFREADPTVDLWWLSRTIGSLCDNLTAVEQLTMLHGLAETGSIDELEQVVVKGLTSTEEAKEKLEELSHIKQEIRRLYTKLVSLT